MQGELDLFVAALADLKAERGYAPQLLAITGTNGKTTTTALTALLVERAGRRVAVAGNIGPTMLDTLAAALDADAAAEPAPLPEVWVLELSSFQLDGVQRLRARRGRRCSTSRRTTSTGTARWRPMPRPRRASSASTRVMVHQPRRPGGR